MTTRLEQGPRVFVGLGSNLDDPARQVRQGLERLVGLPGIELVASSDLYQSPPWGITEQPAFVNAVAELSCALAPADLLAELLNIERAAGRVRERRWGPRIIDLDVLAYGQCVFRTAALQLPHPGIGERAFVLVPWAQIAPDFSVPGLGRVNELLARCRGVESVTRLAAL